MFTNWGRSAKKNKATLGFNIFVKKPCLNVFFMETVAFSDDIIILDQFLQY